jgi:type I restriction enzyme S subunit
VDSKDGEWGESEQAVGLREATIIRGTDFSDLDNPGADFPRRWVKEHIVERKRLQPGDIILETAGGTSSQSTGRSALLKNSFFFHHSDLPVLCASFSRHLRLNTQEYSPRFIFYLLQMLHSVGYMAVFNIQHTGVSRFQYTAFKNHTQLQIPKLPIQRQIAAILSAYDELIENNKRRIALLERLAEQIYREWFVRLRFPGYEKAKFIKGIPATWKVKRFSEIADFTMGQSPPSKSYNESGEGLPFHQGVGTYGNRFPRKITYCTAKGRKARKGDILFSVRAPVGRLNIADCEMIIGRGLAAIRHKEGHNSYLLYLLKVVFASEDIIGNGSIFNSVGKDELAKFPVLQPDDDLVVQFQSAAASIDRQIEILSRAVENLSGVREMLLPRLISGKLSVENLDIHFPPSMTEELEAVPTAAAYA